MTPPLTPEDRARYRLLVMLNMPTLVESIERDALGARLLDAYEALEKENVRTKLHTRCLENLAAHPEPATPTTGPTWDQVLAILSAHYDALSQQPEHRHFRAGVWSAYERIQAAKRAHTPVPPETPIEEQP